MGKFSLSMEEIERQMSLVNGSRTIAALDNRKNDPQLTVLNPVAKNNTDKLPALNVAGGTPVETKTASVELPKANSSALPDMNLAILSKPETNNDKIERWLNPSYKMSKEEKKEAKKLSDAFMSEVHNRKFDGSDEEYKRMTDLYNKSHTGAAVMAGIMDAVPFYDSVMDATLKAAGVDGSFSEYMDKTSENTRKQNPVAYTAANIGTNIGEYALGTKALEALGVLGKGGKLTQGVSKVVKNPKLASSVANVLGDTSLDVALDTVPSAVENAQSGMNGADVAKEAAKNVATNLAFNIGGEAISNAMPVLKKIADNKKIRNTDDIVSLSDIADEIPINTNMIGMNDLKTQKELLLKQFSDFADGKFPRSERFTISDSMPQYFQNYGNADNPLQLRQRKYKDITSPKNDKKHMHGLSDVEVARIIDDINSPVAVFESGSIAGRPVVVGGRVDADEHPIMSAIQMDETTDAGTYNKLATSFGKDTLADDLLKARSENRMLFENKEKVDELISGGGLQSSKRDTNINLSDNSISNPQNNVNAITEEVAKKFDINNYPDATDAYKATKKNIHNMFNMFGTKEQEEVVMKAVDEFVENPSIEKYIEVQTLLGNEADKLVGTEYHYKGNKAQKLGKTRKFDKEYDYMSAFDSVDELYNSVRDRAKANVNKVMPEDIGLVPKSESIEIPVEGYGKVSKARTNTLEKSGINTPDELANKYLDESNFTYVDTTEKVSMGKARERVATDGVDFWKDKLMAQEDFASEDVDTMMLVYTDKVRQARETGNEELWKEAGTVFKKIQEVGSKMGAGVQAFAKWGRQTPEGVVANTFRNVKEKITKQLGEKKAVEIVDQLTEELQKEIYELAETAFNEGFDSQAGKEAFAQIGKVVNRNTPKSLKGVVKSYLMDSMLLNFRTLISRNAGGNLGYNAMEFMRQPITAGIDAATSKFTGQRTRTGWSADKISSALNGLAKGISDEATDIRKGIHTAKSGQNSIEDAIYSNAHPFKGNNAITKALNGIDDMTKHGLSVGDRPFYEAAYKQRMSELNNLRQRGLLSEEAMKLSDDDFNTMAELAAKIDGLTATYQDDAAMGQALDAFKSAIGKFSKGYAGADVLSQFVMPFTRTPGNIITRSLEYSPYGVVKNAVETANELKKGEFNQQRFVDETGRNILGAGLFGAGIAAYDNGLITGGYSDDKDMANAQKQAGMQEYALNTGNGNFDISWLPVLGNDLVAAAAFKEAYNADEENPLSAGVQGALTGANTLLNTSTLQGMNRMFGGNTSYSTEQNLLGNAKDALTSGFGQAIPSSLRQGVQSVDPYQRNISNGEREYWQNNLMASLPVLREQLQPKVDNEGNIMMQNQGRDLGSRIVENMISPGKYTELQDSIINNEAMRLFESTGNNIAFLPTPNRKDISGGETDVTDKQFFDYQVSLGSKNAETGQAVIESDFYASLSDEQKEKALQDVYSAMKAVAKEESIKGYTSDDKIAAAYKENGPQGVVDYMQEKHTLDSAGISSTNEIAKEYYANGNFDEYQEINNAIKSYGFDTNDSSSMKFINQYGLDAYKDAGDAIEQLGMKQSSENRKLYMSGGLPVLRMAKAADNNNDGSVSKKNELIPYLKNQSWSAEEKNRVVEQFGFSTKNLKW